MFEISKSEYLIAKENSENAVSAVQNAKAEVATAQANLDIARAGKKDAKGWDANKEQRTVVNEAQEVLKTAEQKQKELEKADAEQSKILKEKFHNFNIQCLVVNAQKYVDLVVELRAKVDADPKTFTDELHAVAKEQKQWNEALADHDKIDFKVAAQALHEVMAELNDKLSSVSDINMKLLSLSMIKKMRSAFFNFTAFLPTDDHLTDCSLKNDSHLAVFEFAHGLINLAKSTDQENANFNILSFLFEGDHGLQGKIKFIGKFVREARLEHINPSIAKYDGFLTNAMANYTPQHKSAEVEALEREVQQFNDAAQQPSSPMPEHIDQDFVQKVLDQVQQEVGDVTAAAPVTGEAGSTEPTASNEFQAHYPQWQQQIEQFTKTLMAPAVSTMGVQALQLQYAKMNAQCVAIEAFINKNNDLVSKLDRIEKELTLAQSQVDEQLNQEPLTYEALTELKALLNTDKAKMLPKNKLADLQHHVDKVIAHVDQKHQADEDGLKENNSAEHDQYQAVVDLLQAESIDFDALTEALVALPDFDAKTQLGKLLGEQSQQFINDLKNAKATKGSHVVQKSNRQAYFAFLDAIQATPELAEQLDKWFNSSTTGKVRYQQVDQGSVADVSTGTPPTPREQLQSVGQGSNDVSASSLTTSAGDDQNEVSEVDTTPVSNKASQRKRFTLLKRTPKVDTPAENTTPVEVAHVASQTSLTEDDASMTDVNDADASQTSATPAKFSLRGTAEKVGSSLKKFGSRFKKDRSSAEKLAQAELSEVGVEIRPVARALDKDLNAEVPPEGNSTLAEPVSEQAAEKSEKDASVETSAEVREKSAEAAAVTQTQPVAQELVAESEGEASVNTTVEEHDQSEQESLSQQDAVVMTPSSKITGGRFDLITFDQRRAQTLNVYQNQVDQALKAIGQHCATKLDDVASELENVVNNVDAQEARKQAIVTEDSTAEFVKELRASIESAFNPVTDGSKQTNVSLVHSERDALVQAVKSCEILKDELTDFMKAAQIQRELNPLMYHYDQVNKGLQQVIDNTYSRLMKFLHAILKRITKTQKHWPAALQYRERALQVQNELKQAYVNTLATTITEQDATGVQVKDVVQAKDDAVSSWKQSATVILGEAKYVSGKDADGKDVLEGLLKHSEKLINRGFFGKAAKHGQQLQRTLHTLHDSVTPLAEETSRARPEQVL